MRRNQAREMRPGAGAVGDVDRGRDAPELTRPVEERAGLGCDRRREFRRDDEIAGLKLPLELARGSAWGSGVGHGGRSCNSRASGATGESVAGAEGRGGAFLRPAYLL